jgi:hypothetical protein
MYEVGQEEIDAVSRIIRDRALFRHGVGQACDRFEARNAAAADARKFDLKQGA